MNVQKLAEQIVDQFVPASVTSGSGIRPEALQSLLAEQRERRKEAILTVRSMIADAITPEDQ